MESPRLEGKYGQAAPVNILARLESRIRRPPLTKALAPAGHGGHSLTDNA